MVNLYDDFATHAKFRNEIELYHTLFLYRYKVHVKDFFQVAIVLRDRALPFTSKPEGW